MAPPSSSPPSCPSEEVLVAFVEGALDGSGAAAFEEHLDVCKACSRLVATYAGAYLSRGDAANATPGSSSTSMVEGPRRVEELLRARALPPGAVVGRYVVLDCLGEGASSVVYGAYDPELDRKVALKVLRARFGSEASAARATHLREARAMAKLSHEHIVRVHDVGAEGERVFIAMEYVDGPTMRAWLAERARSTEEIEVMMLGAGRGLEAIHAAGLVHRDFKPENVLIGKDGRARVTDLGLARVLGGVTDPGDANAPASDPQKPVGWTNAIAGTPAYMAPEQREGRGADARSDQYAFAITLYEALFGERPNRERHGDASDRLPRLGSIAPRASARPDAPSGRRVSRRVRAALGRALALDPGARFSSMKELLHALEADGARWRRIAMTVAALVVVAAGTWAIPRAFFGDRSRACAGASSELHGVWDPERKQAVAAAFHRTGLRYADAAWQSVERAGDAYASAWVAARTDACEATRVRGVQSDALLTVRMECLDRRRRELDAAATLFAQADPEVVEHAVAAIERLPPISACSDATALLARVPPPDAPVTKRRVETLRDDIDRVRVLDTLGKSRAALPEAQNDVAAARALKYRPVEAEALYVRGTIERSTADFSAAVKTWFEAVSAAEAGRHDELAAEIWAKLVELLAELDRFDDADLCLDRARAAIERNGGAGLAPVFLPEAMGTYYRERGRYPDAIAQHREAIRLEEAALGKEHLEVARSLRNLGNALRDDDDNEAALEAYRRSLAIEEKLLGPDHPDVGNTLQGLAIFFSRLGRYEEATPLFLRTLEIREHSLGENHPRVGETLSSLVVAMRWSGRAAEALPLAERALAIELAAYGPNHDVTAGAENNVGFILLALHDYDKARASFERALSTREKLLGPEHTKVAIEVENLGLTALAEKDFAAALRFYERGLAIDEKALKPDHPDLAYALVGLGLARLGLGKAADAIAPLERAVLLRGKGRVPPRARAEAELALARALWDADADRVRAVRLASDAREAYAGAGRAFVEERREVAAWLAAHPAP